MMAVVLDHIPLKQQIQSRIGKELISLLIKKSFRLYYLLPAVMLQDIITI